MGLGFLKLYSTRPIPLDTIDEASARLLSLQGGEFLPSSWHMTGNLPNLCPQLGGSFLPSHTTKRTPTPPHVMNEIKKQPQMNKSPAQRGAPSAGAFIHPTTHPPTYHTHGSDPIPTEHLHQTTHLLTRTSFPPPRHSPRVYPACFLSCRYLEHPRLCAAACLVSSLSLGALASM